MGFKTLVPEEKWAALLSEAALSVVTLHRSGFLRYSDLDLVHGMTPGHDLGMGITQFETRSQVSTSRKSDTMRTMGR